MTHYIGRLSRKPQRVACAVDPEKALGVSVRWRAVDCIGCKVRVIGLRIKHPNVVAPATIYTISTNLVYFQYSPTRSGWMTWAELDLCTLLPRER